MSKKKSSTKAKEVRKTANKPTADPSLVPTTSPAAAPAATSEKARPIIRAIRVTKEILDAAKAYKRVTGVSFYQLGLEAISERLTKEGYLNRPTGPKPKSEEAEIAKA